MGSILALFRPSGPLCFPVRAACVFQPREEEQQQQQEQQEGSMSHLYKQWYKHWENIKPCPKLLFFFSRDFLGSILALFRPSEGTLGTSGEARVWRLFRPSGPLCFPVLQRAFSASGGRAAAATGAAGGFYVSLYKQWYKNWSKTIKPCPKLLFF